MISSWKNRTSTKSFVIEETVSFLVSLALFSAVAHMIYGYWWWQ